MSKTEVILVEVDGKGKCEYCGKVAELRPYGKDGAKICFECGMKNREETERNMSNFFSALLGESETTH